MDKEQEHSPENAPPILPKSLGRRILAFFKELWDDHDFWIRVLAAKGGAAAIVITGVVGISAVITAPLLLATAGIAVCAGLIAIGAGGLLWGAATTWDKLREIYHKTLYRSCTEEHKAPVKPLIRQIADSASIKKLRQKPLVQKFLKTHAWKTTRKIAQRWENIFLAGMAGSGGIASTIIGVSIIATNILVLSAVTITSIITLPTVFAASAVLSGLYGVYLSGQSLWRSFRSKKNSGAGVKSKKIQDSAKINNPQPVTAEAMPSFRQAAEKTDEQPPPAPIPAFPSPAPPP